jgi:hypothetical protein
MAKFLPRPGALAAAALAAVLVLLVPLIAMQFSDGVDWTAGDFAAAGVLVFAAGLGTGSLMRARLPRRYRLAAFAVLAALLFLAWAELAVGLFGTPIAGS